MVEQNKAISETDYEFMIQEAARRTRGAETEPIKNSYLERVDIEMRCNFLQRGQVAGLFPSELGDLMQLVSDRANELKFVNLTTRELSAQERDAQLREVFESVRENHTQEDWQSRIVPMLDRFFSPPEVTE